MKKRPSLLLAFALASVFFGTTASTIHSNVAPPQQAPATTLIIDASKFMEVFPKGNTLADAFSLKADWVFNNTAIVLGSQSNLFTRVQIPEAGTYHLYVRGQGEANSSFKILVGGKLAGSLFANGPLRLQRGGSFELPAGPLDLKVTRISGKPALDVVVLSKNSNLTEEDLKPLQLHPDVVLLNEYEIPQSNAVKFGDATGDGQTDFMVLARDFSAHLFDNSGKELWSYKAPEEYTKERSEFEAPGVLWDFTGNGRAEVLHWRFINGKEYLVMADGRTGKILRQTEWPTQPLPHVYNNFRLAVGKLQPGKEHQLVVFTDMGGTMHITAYDAKLKQLWQHVEKRKKDNLGHYVYPVDLNKDGIDEVVVGSLVLDANGKKIWDRFDLFDDNHDHADSYKFHDVDGDGNLDILAAYSEVGVVVYKGMTGEILWQNVAEHTQQIQVGNFLEGVPGPHIAASARIYGNRQIGEPYLTGQVYWFDSNGNLLSKWPGNPVNANPDFVKGNWRGEGKEELFWLKFRLNEQGKGELYFPDPVYHMFDFSGKGADEVITLSGRSLKVFGSKSAKHSGKDGKKDLGYLRQTVVNHTHY